MSLSKKNGNWAGLIGMLGAVVAMSGTQARAEDWGDLEKLQDFVSRMDVQTNLRTMDNMSLTASTLPEQPWSHTFWPDLLGSITWRYTTDHTNDLSYAAAMAIGGWNPAVGRGARDAIMDNGSIMSNKVAAAANDKHRAIYKHRPITELSPDQIDSLSPAEKYDVLMGDSNFTLWQKVIERVDQLENVDLLAMWAGVCHGWAPASLTYPRPLKAVTMDTPSGVKVTFWPDDIKALLAFSWGTAFGGDAQDSAKIEGWQCQTGGHATKYGRLEDPRCADVNPAFFHLVAVNQIGLNQRGFVMDRNYRAEVQNQPTYKYEYRYYSVADRRPDPDKYANARDPLAAASIYRNSLRFDPFKEFRSERGVKIVGVEMTVYYSYEEYHPNHAVRDETHNTRNHTKTLKIKYDLELDNQDNIVGGEWREFDDPDHQTVAEMASYQHPDILWLIPPGVKPFSQGDGFTTTASWDGTGVVPADWRSASFKSTNKQYSDRVNGDEIIRLAPQPLVKVVEALLAKSRQ